MGRLPHFLTYGAPPTRALRARVELRYYTAAGTLHPPRSGEECSEGEGVRNPEEMGTTQQVYFRFRRADTPRVQAVSSGLNNTFQPASVCYRCTFAWNGMLIILIDRNYHELLFKKKRCLTRPGTNWVGSWKRLIYVWPDYIEKIHYKFFHGFLINRSWRINYYFSIFQFYEVQWPFSIMSWQVIIIIEFKSVVYAKHVRNIIV